MERPKRLKRILCLAEILFILGLGVSFAAEIVRFPVEGYSEKISQKFGEYLGLYGGKDYNGHHGGGILQ